MSSKPKKTRVAGNVLVRKGKLGTSYCIRYRDPNGDRQFEVVGRSVDGTTIKDAERVLSERLAAVTLAKRGDDTWRDPRRPSRQDEMTVQQMAEEWLGDQHIEIVRARDGTIRLRSDDFAQNSLDRMRVTVATIIGFFADSRGGVKRSWLITEVTPQEVSRFLSAKRKDGLAPSTVKKLGQALVSMLNLMVEWEHLDRNPATRAVRKLKVGKPRQTSLSSSGEIEALIEAGRELDRREHNGVRTHAAFLSTLVFGGLRISEVLDLRWRHVDLGRGLMKIAGTKTDAAVRTIDILPPLRDALAVIKPSDADPQAYVFATTTGTRQNAANASRRWFHPAHDLASEIRIRNDEEPMPDLTPHGLRHTNVSVLAALGWDIARIAEHVGHEDIHFTHRVYCHTVQRRDGELERFRALVFSEVVDETTSGLPLAA